ncbi:MAG: hypothetical protein PWP65_225 [Clostridia bacterium]|nr:hypothetical protein [Clostridia bacterium]
MKKEIPLDKAYRLLNPGCVVLVTAAYQGRRNVMTLAWQTPLSSRPPLVGIAVAVSHFTHELIAASGEFALNIPGPNLLTAVQRCGKISGRDRDKFEETGLTPVQARKVGVPLIAECLGHLECRVVESYKTGDHTFFVGEALAAGAEEGLFSDHWEEKAEIIHHLGGNWYFVSGRRETG